MSNKQVLDLKAAISSLNAAINAVSADNALTKEFNDATALMTQQIDEAFDNIRKIPDAIRSLTDVKHMEQYIGVEDTLSKYFTLSVTYESSMVPITVDDYYADPYKYPDLQYINYHGYEITLDDCDLSDYKKLDIKKIKNWIPKDVSCYQPSLDTDKVAELANSAISAIGETVKNLSDPIGELSKAAKNIGLNAPLSTIGDQLTKIKESIDSVIALATQNITDEVSNTMLSKKNKGQQVLNSNAQSKSETKTNAGKSLSSMIESAKQESSDALDDVNKQLDEVTDAIKNIKTPELPDDMKETFDDILSALNQVKNDIMNIYITFPIKMFAALLEKLEASKEPILTTLCTALKEVPPFDVIDALAESIPKVIDFATNMPESITNMAKSIMKQKNKVALVAKTPAPKTPTPTKVPLPPVPDDVVYPDDKNIDISKYVDSKISKLKSLASSAV